MSNIGFTELIDMLPRGDELPSKKSPEGFSVLTEANPNFVEPDLVVQQSVMPGTTSVVLLAASGAVGKSTLAADLAVRTSAPLWDLSKFQVGSKTFSGTILEAYDFNATGVLKRFREGRFLFVLDALDEAQVRAGSHNFDAFLSDLATALLEPRQKPSLVLLARSDTADWVQLALEDAGVPLARYQIAYFDRLRAERFIDKRLDARHAKDRRPPNHRLQRQPYSQARDALFALVYDLFSVSHDRAWDDPRVAGFLGYAPVLETLTDYLYVPNYMVLIRELQEEVAGARDPWHFLAEIIDRLLARERSKLQDAIRPQLEPLAEKARWSEWDILYTAPEQCARVLSYSLRSSGSGSDLTLPIAIGVAYEEALRTQLPQHPFLAGRAFANVVFKEYIYAWGLIHGGHLLSSGLRELMRARDEPFLPSQLFSWFFLRFAESGTAVVDGQDFGAFYESLWSRHEDLALTLFQSGDLIEAAFTLSSGDSEETRIDLLDTGSGIHFWRRLGNAEIDIRSGVRLGLPEQRFVLGPAVELSCNELVVACELIDIDPSGDVRLRASSYLTSATDLRLRVREETGGTMAVSWPRVGHPWASYRTALPQGLSLLQDSVKGDTLRKFILMFRRQRTRKASTLSGSRWSPEQLKHRDELLDLAYRRGVLQRVGGHDAVELTSQFDSLRTLVVGTPRLSDQARDFVWEFLGPEEASRVLASSS